MTRRARIGVIGAGWWAAVNHLPVLSANEDCEVVAVNRLGAEELAELQRKFDVPLGFEDYRAMLDQVPMDGVVISSPHQCCITSTQSQRLPKAVICWWKSL